jgi:hypothetical protein
VLVSSNSRALYGTVTDIVLKFIVAVPDWPWRVNCVVTGLLPPLPPPLLPQEINPTATTIVSINIVRPRAVRGPESPQRNMMMMDAVIRSRTAEATLEVAE